MTFGPLFGVGRISGYSTVGANGLQYRYLRRKVTERAKEKHLHHPGLQAEA